MLYTTITCMRLVFALVGLKRAAQQSSRGLYHRPTDSLPVPSSQRRFRHRLPHRYIRLNIPAACQLVVASENLRGRMVRTKGGIICCGLLVLSLWAMCVQGRWIRRTRRPPAITAKLTVLSTSTWDNRSFLLFLPWAMSPEINLMSDDTGDRQFLTSICKLPFENVCRVT